jgi:LPXTG-motif cell wall-anchored protein
VIEPVRDNWVIALGVLVLLGALLVWWRSRR